MLHKKFNQNLSTCAFLNKKLTSFHIVLKLKTIYGRTHRKKIKKPCSYGNLVKICFHEESQSCSTVFDKTVETK